MTGSSMNEPQIALTTPSGEPARVLAEFGPALAIDSSLGTAVAVSTGEQIISVSVDDPLSHAEVVGELISLALEHASLRPRELTQIVSGVGPGPFTGLRVGIAAAHGFASALALPIRSLLSHDAIAFGWFAEHPDAESVRVVTDARRRELAITDYTFAHQARALTRMAGPELVDASAFSQAPLGRDEVRFTAQRVNAAELLELAALRFVTGSAFEPDGALYLRAPDATASTAPKRVTG